MKHYSITLERHDRSVRQWGVWANTLTIGSHPKSSLVLPQPLAEHLAEFDHDGVLDLPLGRLLIHDDTPLRESLWAKARDRMALARKLEWKEPGARDRRRTAALSALSAFGLLGILWIQISGRHPPKVPDQAIPIDFIVALTPEVTPPPPPPPVEIDRAPVETHQATTTPDPSTNGGSTTTQTVAIQQTNPATVLQHSVMGMLDDLKQSAIGEGLVDPNEKNLIDVMLAGNQGIALRGVGGQGPHGEGDRMSEVHGTGIGYQGHHGIGPGGDGGRPGPRNIGGSPDGSPIPRNLISKPRTIPPPTTNDVAIGGDAGTRSPESILRVIRSSLGGFQYTYQKYLRDHPELGGKISLKFTIAPSGDIIAMELVSSNTGNGQLDEEIRDKARRMRFDPIERGNITVTYAFVLDKQ